MSEKTRSKKAGQEKSAERQATNRGRNDPDANKPKPKVQDDKQAPDSFDKDLKRGS
ncbi:MAG TPA: hypothetical protein VGE01_13785 [Fimbriimonas sp.]